MPGCAILGCSNQFEEDYWDLLRQGFNLKDAVNDSLPPAGGTRILENFAAYGVSSWQQAAGYPLVKTKAARIKKRPGSSGCLNGAKASALGRILRDFACLLMRLGFLLRLF